MKYYGNFNVGKQYRTEDYNQKAKLLLFTNDDTNSYYDQKIEEIHFNLAAINCSLNIFNCFL